MYQLIEIYSSPYCGKWTTSGAGVAYVGFPGGAVVKNLPAKAADAGDTGLIPGWGKSYRLGSDNSPQYSRLENSVDRGAWRATVHGAAKSRTCLSIHGTRCLHLAFALSDIADCMVRPLKAAVLFSLNILYSTSACFTYMLLTWLTVLYACPRP